MNGYDLLDYLENKEKQVRECVKNNSDTYAIFSCPKEYEKEVREELEHLNIQISLVPSIDTESERVEYVILKERKEQVDNIVNDIIRRDKKDFHNDYSYDISDTEFTKPAKISLRFGILSIIFIWCCGLLGIIFAIMGIIFGCLQKKDYRGKKPRMAIAGIVLSIISLTGIIALLILMPYYNNFL